MEIIDLFFLLRLLFHRVVLNLRHETFGRLESGNTVGGDIDGSTLGDIPGHFRRTVLDDETAESPEEHAPVLTFLVLVLDEGVLYALHKRFNNLLNLRFLYSGLFRDFINYIGLRHVCKYLIIRNRTVPSRTANILNLLINISTPYQFYSPRHPAKRF